MNTRRDLGNLTSMALFYVQMLPKATEPDGSPTVDPLVGPECTVIVGT